MKLYVILSLIAASLISTFLSIYLSKRESEQYSLNVREQILVYCLSLMFTSWVIISRWETSNLYAVILLTICFSVLSISFYIDAKLQELPDCVTAIVLLCVFALLAQPGIIALGWINFFYRILFASIVTFICFIFSIKTENLGMGDVKLLFPMLLLMGIDTSVLTGGYKFIYYLYNVLTPAFVVGLIVLLITKKKDMKIAFGPFMILGFVLTFSILPISIFAL